MDRGSVISLSSSSSKKSENPNTIVTLSSETRRVPVSWDSPKKPSNKLKVLEFEKTPNHCEKVNKWMQTCSYTPQDLSGSNASSTCIRYDFDKSPKTVTVQKSCYTKTTPLFSYMEEAKKFSNMNIKNKGVENLLKLNGGKNKEDFTTPLSPDSQKKELCNYLQLMKPDEKQNSFFIEYRRSGRVKKQNLNTDKLKKEPEKGNKDKKSLESQHPALKSFGELKLTLNKLKNIANTKRKRSNAELSQQLLPLPPRRYYSEVVDFEDSMKEIVKHSNQEVISPKVVENVENSSSKKNGCLKKVKKRRKFRFGMRLPQKLRGQFIYKRINLRSKRCLKYVSLDTIFLRKNQMKKKKRKKIIKKSKENEIEKQNVSQEIDNIKATELTNPEHNSVAGSPRCEIISVYFNSDDENVDLRNFVDDMLELDLMSEEHRKSVIESRILASSSITNLINKRKEEADVQKAYKIFSELSERKSCEGTDNNQAEAPKEAETTKIVLELENIENTVEQDERKSDKNEEEVDNQTSVESDVNQNLVMDLVISEHDYANVKSLPIDEYAEDEEEDDEDEVEVVEVENNGEVDIKHEEKVCETFCVEVTQEVTSEVEEKNESVKSLSPVPLPTLEILPFRKEVEMKNLHRSLTLANRRKSFLNNCLQNWGSNSNLNKKIDHAITISPSNGEILRGFYQDFNLIICQKNLISFTTQSALGNILGAQNMWIPKGEIPRIALNSTYTQKNATDMVITTETSVAFVELWAKEHKSEVREVPLADVFAIVYFWRLRQNGLDKKALQLENIQGFAEDVQYCVLKSYPKIIVSWHCIEGTDKKTKIRSYHLAADFQTVANISEIQPAQHCVKSLHNIEDCDSLIMGCGENKVTLWNIEYGYIVTTVEMINISPPISTLWVKCDRGFLFIIQECDNQELRLIAVNGMNHSWKKLQNYVPPPGFDGLKGVCVENGILVGYYSQGILCWNAQTGGLIVEELPSECEYVSSGKYVIMIVNENIIVRHSLSHLITDL